MSELGRRKEQRQREVMKRRTMNFGLRIIRTTESLARDQTARVIGNQLLRVGTSVGANYRAALTARSRADFIAKLGIVEEEADESIYWMQMLGESGAISADRLRDLLQEAIASIKTARSRSLSPKSANRNPK